MTFVTRGGEKLAHALKEFHIAADGRPVADLGSHKGGFVDCWLQAGASRVLSVDTSYGTLDWKLRQDPRVVVLERCNAMHWTPEESVDLVSLDVGWTPQSRILPHVWNWLPPCGQIISLVKPQYECGDEDRDKGVVKTHRLDAVLTQVLEDLTRLGLPSGPVIRSPIPGGAGNTEFLLHLIKPSS